MDAMLAVRHAMLTVGRQTVTGCGAAWPDDIDACVDAYYQRELGASMPADSADMGSFLSTSPTTRMASPGE